MIVTANKCSPDAAVTAGAPERIALRVLQIGASATVLAASALTQFDLDRFLIPKDLVFHATALVAGVFAIRVTSRTIGKTIDWFLLAYLALSAVSALLSTNGWLGFRALAISASSVIVFWTARGLKDAGLDRPLLNGIAFAVVLASITSLLQTYGVRIIFFSMNRAPGGTLGNRNWVAHVAAFGFPICLLAALRARKLLWPLIGVAFVAAALVLTRSRAAWLASVFMAVVFVVVFASAVWRRAPLSGVEHPWKRLATAFFVAVCGAGAALILPNALHWRSDNPYLQSISGITNYEEGSGRGRLIQYQRSLRMAASSPILGVGPGNWTVEYPRFVPRGDPSMNPSAPGMTFNPWPSSDWVAFVSERGFIGTILMIIIVVMIALRPEPGLAAAALLAALAAAMLCGLFDAVLILPLPALLAWASFGALWRSGQGSSHKPLLIAVLVVCAFGVARSTAQLTAMEMYATRSSGASLERAARIDPGSFALHLRLARSGNRRQRCDHARIAHKLFPNSQGARNLAAHCGE